MEVRRRHDWAGEEALIKPRMDSAVEAIVRLMQKNSLPLVP
jgi:hypothetical protein